jgi:hypothetical protein
LLESVVEALIAEIGGCQFVREPVAFHLKGGAGRSVSVKTSLFYKKKGKILVWDNKGVSPPVSPHQHAQNRGR